MVVKSLFYSHVLFFLLQMFVPIILLSTQQQSHGLTSDCACMCTHIYTHTMTSLLEIVVYDRLPANFSIQHVDKETERREEEEEEKLMTIVRTISNTHTFDFSITPADTKSFFFFFYVLVYIINHRTVKLRKRKNENLIYIVCVP